MTGLKRRLRAARSFAMLAGAVLARRPLRPRSLAQRLAAVPLDGAPVSHAVEIRWNRHQIPWIEAETDRDAAVALGLVHAHLRLGQMEVLRHVAHGRTAELLGPIAIEVDRALRAIGVTRAVPGILAAMPEATRDWLDGFVDGINHAVAAARELPPDCALLGIGRAPWTAEDVMAVGRAAVADVNWALWLRVMRLRHDQAWPELWERLMTHGTGSVATLAGRDPGALLAGAIGLAASRCGSNAWAVAGSASATGGALLASDPHLPITLPNIWLAAGYRSPSYHVVGLMLPGLPFVAIGRNPWIAWGGTSPHAAVSDLFDLSGIAPPEITAAREEVIRVRGGAPERVTLRETRWGPLVSDALPMRGGPFALRWVGHEPSDELSAMLGMNRARSFAEFAEAADGMAVPGQNFVVAEAAGGVAKQIAGKYPRRPLARRASGFAVPPEELEHWRGFATARDFPPERDPRRGFVVSANDRPPEMPVPVSFIFSTVDRAERIAQVLAGSRPVTPARMAALQRDVRAAGLLPVRDRLLRLATELRTEGDAGLVASLDAVVPLIADWDGSYDADSRSALAFELLLARLSEQRHGEAERALHAAIWTARALIARDLDTADPAALKAGLAVAMRRAAADLGRWRVWGDIHRLRIAHILGALPVVGRRLVFADLPVGGTSDAVMKTAHAAVPRPHRVFFGSIARFVTDLAEQDGSQAVLLGGQDGWLGSDTLLDQLPLWREGRMVRLPMSREGVRTAFPHLQRLLPPDDAVMKRA